VKLPVVIVVAAAMCGAGALGAAAYHATIGHATRASVHTDRLDAALPAPHRAMSHGSGAAQGVTATAIDAALEHAFSVAHAAVVYIDNVGVDSGSGVIYDSSGDIVTNAHVVTGTPTLRVTLESGQTLPARLVGTDTADDLAVIHIAATGLPAARFSAGPPRVAQMALAIGSPLGLQQSVTTGVISALDRTVQESGGAYLPDAIQTSAPINPGNSGGALVDLDGTVLGIPTLEELDPQNNNGGAAQGIGFAVPSTRVTYIAHQLIATGEVAHTGRAYLGVTVSDPAPGTVVGAIVLQVRAGTPAARAGLRVGDVLTALDGRALMGEADLLAALTRQRPGEVVAFTLSRGGRTQRVRLRLGELSAAR